jgi:hypothetical protein
VTFSKSRRSRSSALMASTVFCTLSGNLLRVDAGCCCDAGVSEYALNVLHSLSPFFCASVSEDKTAGLDPKAIPSIPFAERSISAP